MLMSLTLRRPTTFHHFPHPTNAPVAAADVDGQAAADGQAAVDGQAVTEAAVALADDLVDGKIARIYAAIRSITTMVQSSAAGAPLSALL